MEWSYKALKFFKNLRLFRISEILKLIIINYLNCFFIIIITLLYLMRNLKNWIFTKMLKFLMKHVAYKISLIYLLHIWKFCFHRNEGRRTPANFTSSCNRHNNHFIQAGNNNKFSFKCSHCDRHTLERNYLSFRIPPPSFLFFLQGLKWGSGARISLKLIPKPVGSNHTSP